MSGDKITFFILFLKAKHLCLGFASITQYWRTGANEIITQQLAVGSFFLVMPKAWQSVYAFEFLSINKIL